MAALATANIQLGYQGKFQLRATPVASLSLDAIHVTASGQMAKITGSGKCKFIDNGSFGKLQIITKLGSDSIPVKLSITGESFTLQSAQGSDLLVDPVQFRLVKSLEDRVILTIDVFHDHLQSERSLPTLSGEFECDCQLIPSTAESMKLASVVQSKPRIGSVFQNATLQIELSEKPPSKGKEPDYKSTAVWLPAEHSSFDSTSTKYISVGVGNGGVLLYPKKGKTKWNYMVSAILFKGESKPVTIMKIPSTDGSYFECLKPKMVSLELKVLERTLSGKPVLVFRPSGAFTGFGSGSRLEVECKILGSQSSKPFLMHSASGRYRVSELGQFSVSELATDVLDASPVWMQGIVVPIENLGFGPLREGALRETYTFAVAARIVGAPKGVAVTDVLDLGSVKAGSTKIANLSDPTEWAISSYVVVT